MVVQTFLEPAVHYLGAVVPGFFQLAASPVLYLLLVVLLVALVFQGVQVLGAQVFLGEQILVVLVFRGVLALAALVARVFRGALFLGGLEVPLFLELAALWLDLDRLVVLKIPGVLEVPEVLEAGRTFCLPVFFFQN